MGCSPWGCYELGTTEWLHFHFSLSCIGEGNGNPLQCSCLENPRDGGDWWAAVYGVAQSQTQLKELSSRYHIRRESKCRIVRTVAPINSESMCKSFFCLSHMCMYTPKKVYELFIIFFNLILFFNFTILYWFCHISKWIHHRYTHVPHPEPSSLPVPFLWVVPVYQPQASSIVHRTWTSDSFHIWYYTCFNAILPNHPTLSLSHRVHKTVLYISVSFAVSYTGLLLPSF